MRAYTVMLRPQIGGPLLIPEGFSLSALVLGPVWLAMHRAFVPAALLFAAWIVAACLPAALAAVAVLGLLWCQGLFGNDLWRWEFARRGYALAHVVLGRDRDTAWARLLAARPDLIARMAR